MALRVKIEGITSVADAKAAIRYGADEIGLVFAKSPRRVDIKKARRIVASLGPLVQSVGLFVDATIEEIVATGNAVGFDMLQLHGKETPRWINQHLDAPFIKAFHPRSAGFAGQLQRFGAGLDRRVRATSIANPRPNSSTACGGGQ